MVNHRIYQYTSIGRALDPSYPTNKAVIVLIAIVLYQQGENYFFAPRITARTMELHPAVAFGAALGGASLLGFVGALLALPAAAIDRGARAPVTIIWSRSSSASTGRANVTRPAPKAASAARAWFIFSPPRLPRRARKWARCQAGLRTHEWRVPRRLPSHAKTRSGVLTDELIYRCGGSDGIAVGAPSSRLNARRGNALHHLAVR